MINQDWYVDWMDKFKPAEMLKGRTMGD